MQTNTLIKRQNIIQNLSYLPDKKLDELDTFLKFLLFQINQPKKTTEPKTLSGIWSNIGFEKIVDLDTEISKIRKEFSDNILTKTFK